MAGDASRLAVLIDGDNVSPDLTEQVFALAAQLGQLTIRNVYGCHADKDKWLDAASRFALSQARRHLHATGKNATDIEMVIGAMDIMASGAIDGICLVSSDKDFTSLAIRLREGGKRVYGFGGATARESWRSACDRFYFLDAPVKSVAQAAAKPAATKQPAVKQSVTKPRLPVDQAVHWLREAFDICAKKDGWAPLSETGHHLRRLHPGFSAKDYGSAGFKKLITECGAFEFQKTGNRDLFRPKTSAQSLKLVKS